MQSHFKRIALIGKPDAERIAENLASLYEHLLQRGHTIVMEQACSSFLKGDHPAHPLHELAKHCDLAIVVGGDGTLLAAARVMAEHNIPLIGVNLGRLGFLVDISPHEALAKLDEILMGHYRAEERMILRAKLIRGEAIIQELTAVNEVVIHSESATSMIEIVTRIDGAFVNSQRSDGLIVSTPTGSTAYALSGGGPILYPTLKAIVLVPINPHSLTNRPIVIADDSQVEITFKQSKQFKAQLTCDGISTPDVKIGDRIHVSKEPRPFNILHPHQHDFFDILRAKLHWSSSYRN